MGSTEMDMVEEEENIIIKKGDKLLHLTSGGDERENGWVLQVQSGSTM